MKNQLKILIPIVLFSFLFISGYGQSKTYFTIENVTIKNDSDNIFLEYRIANTSKSNIKLVEAEKFVFTKFFAWELEIKDSLENKYESSLMIKRKPLSEKDFIQLKPNDTFVIKYELIKYDFMICDSGKLGVKNRYQSEQQIKYPLTIKLNYNCDGTYINSLTGKTKKMKRAKFNCESKELIVKR